MNTTVIPDSVEEVQQFAVGQLRWLARRGTKDRRCAARIFADLIPRLAEPVRNAMTPGEPSAPTNVSGTKPPAAA
jgi:hypothetical protein